MNKFLDNYFKLSENGTNTKQEFIAGITTFMTMAYILIVNPSILSAAGMDAGAIFTATASNTTGWGDASPRASNAWGGKTRW